MKDYLSLPNIKAQTVSACFFVRTDSLGPPVRGCLSPRFSRSRPACLSLSFPLPSRLPSYRRASHPPDSPGPLTLPAPAQRPWRSAAAHFPRHRLPLVLPFLQGAYLSRHMHSGHGGLVLTMR
jgi:hypothetical protein